MIEKIHFKTDGIRGIFNEDCSIELFLRLGKVIHTLGVDTIYVATDTRESKDALAFAFISGCLSTKLNVIYAGVLPTPALMYISKMFNAVGAMITASHNPYEYNGIKIVHSGEKLTGFQEQIIEKRLSEPINSLGVGEFTYRYDLRYIYIRKVQQIAVNTQFKVCIDCANGSFSTIAPSIMKKYCKEVISLADNPDGKNINDGVGSTAINFLRENVLFHKCDIGFAYDGDGDRVICVDKKGNILDGDLLLYILACYYKEVEDIKKIVVTIMSNLGVIRALNKEGIECVEVPVGDKNVYEAMKKENLFIGGEASGHILIPSIFPCGDGLVTSLLLLKILKEKGYDYLKKANEIAMYPHIIKNIKKENFKLTPEIVETIEMMKKEMKYDCKIMIRPSGTEQLIRISVMGKDKNLVEKYSKELENYIINS